MAFVANAREQSTLSNYEAALVKHLHLELVVDFAAKKLVGAVTATVERRVADVREVVLDTNHLAISGAGVAGDDGAVTAAEWSLDDAIEPFGRALRVPLPPGAAGSTVRVRVEYETTAAGGALQFLDAAQTAGKTHPYVFSQCQAIHCRSMIPCQDAPGVKVTLSAAVTAPAGLTALMSAIPDAGGEPTAAPEGTAAGPGARVFTFTQRIPMPSYLIAIAVGDIAGQRVGPRTTVYAEPCVLERAAWEFGETEKFLAAAEALVGPYVWGQYNILLMPPSFPFGGMENVALTVVTPTLLAGDRSLVDVIAHEAAHSWTGNSVTSAASNSFWLNEGFTMMLQRKIIAALHGRPAFDFDAVSGEMTLEETIRLLTERGQGEYTKLVPDLTGVDPDDSFSSIPYEKGFYLLAALQQRVGEAAFNAYLHDYVQTFKYKAISSGDWLAYTRAYFAEGRHALPRVAHHGPPVHNGATGAPQPEEDAAALGVLNDGSWGVPPAGVDAEAAAAAAASSSIDLTDFPFDAFLSAPGAPPVKVAYDRAERGVVDAHAEAWVHGADAAAVAAEGKAITAGWRAAHWIAFCERLAAIAASLDDASPRAVIAPAVLRRIDAAYGLSSQRNAEVRAAWGALKLHSGLEDALPDVLDFLREQGRMKFVRPLFRELLRSSFGRQPALDLFASHGPSYHPICAKMVAVDIEKETAKPAVDASTLAQVDGAAKPARPAATSEANETAILAAELAAFEPAAAADAAADPASAAAGEPAPAPAAAGGADGEGVTASSAAAAAAAADGVEVEEVHSDAEDDAEVEEDEDEEVEDEDEEDDAAPVRKVRFGAGTRRGGKRPAAATTAASRASPSSALATAAAAASAAVLTPAAAAARAALLKAAELRAANPALSPLAAARLSKGIAAPAWGEDGEGDAAGGAGASGGVLQRLSAALSVAPATAETLSTVLAAGTVVGVVGWLAYAIWRQKL